MQPSANVVTEYLSLEEWAALPEDEPGELVDGRLEEEEMPSLAHEVTVSFLIRSLGNWIASAGGIVVGSESKFAVRQRRGRKPDASVWLPDQPKPSRNANLHRQPPSIAIEVITPTPRDGRRDRLEKVDEYASFGIRWYWLIDPTLRTLEVLELRPEGVYAHALGAANGRLDRIPGCLGLVLDLDALWAEIDRLPDDEPGPTNLAP